MMNEKIRDLLVRSGMPQEVLQDMFFDNINMMKYMENFAKLATDDYNNELGTVRKTFYVETGLSKEEVIEYFKDRGRKCD